jgi:deoxycytidine triphosphate deaminase
MSVLGRTEFQKHLREGVFVEGTWREENLRGAGYDLRIARDYLILPNGRRYWSAGPAGHRRRETTILLKPGKVAFVTSVEELAMPPGLAGNIAVKFRNSMDGILVLGGFLVDPGYHGRLHFQLANIGSEPFEIVPEETSVAALQLLPVEGDPDLHNHPAPRTEPMLAAMFNSEMKDERLGPLAFFALRGQTKSLEKRLARGMEEIRVMKRSSTQLIVFGLFVIFAAILAGALATIMSA